MSTSARKSRSAAAALAGFMVLTVLLLSSACTSRHKESGSEEKQPAPVNTASGDHLDGGNYCLQTLIQGPPPSQPLHFSNKVVSSDPSSKSKEYEADLSGDSLDVTYHERWLATDTDRAFIEDNRKFDDPKSVIHALKDGYAEGTFINHYARSDQSGWRMAATSLAQGGTPWNLFVSKPTVKHIGPETVNGYETVKYEVDTTHDSQTDKAALLMMGGMKDYNITGTAWVLKDVNCVLQYSIDYEQDGKDGKVTKTHYEGNITRK